MGGEEDGCGLGAIFVDGGGATAEVLVDNVDGVIMELVDDGNEAAGELEGPAVVFLAPEDDPVLRRAVLVAGPAVVPL